MRMGPGARVARGEGAKGGWAVAGDDGFAHDGTLNPPLGRWADRVVPARDHAFRHSRAGGVPGANVGIIPESWLDVKRNVWVLFGWGAVTVQS